VTMRSFSTCLRQDIFDTPFSNETVHYACDRLLVRHLKKSKSNLTPQIKDHTISSFLHVNQLAASREISLDPVIVGEARSFIEHALVLAHRRYHNANDVDELYVPTTFSLAAVLGQWSLSPHSSNGILGCAAPLKLSQAWTCTKSALPYVRLMRRLNPYLASYDKKSGFELVECRGSKLSVVPKNDDTGRTIAVQPLGNMALGLGLARVLEDALQCVGFDIKSRVRGNGKTSPQHERNKRLARLGSLTSKYATLDLKSASDLITLPLLDLLWPGDVASFIHTIRCEYTHIPGVGDRRLHMVGTMGEGFTFPFMTLTMLALVYATARVNRGYGVRHHFISNEHYAVFGDDIIVPTELFSHTCEVLHAAGLLVNTDKSYSTGAFRESCGGDYLNGEDVTPFYVKALDTLPQLYVALNLTLDFCAVHSVFFKRTISFLISEIRKRSEDRKVLFVPEWHNPDEGLLSPEAPKEYMYLRYRPARFAYGKVPKGFKSRIDRYHFDQDILSMVIVGGYVRPNESGTACFAERDLGRVELQHGSIPQGWSKGRCTLRYTEVASSWRSLLADACM